MFLGIISLLYLLPCTSFARTRREEVGAARRAAELHAELVVCDTLIPIVISWLCPKIFAVGQLLTSFAWQTAMGARELQF